MIRKIAAILGLALVSACGSESSDHNSDGTGGTGPSGTGGVGGCMGDCGPPIDDFFDNGKLANLKLTFTEEDLKPYGVAPAQWLDLLWDKWNNHCGPYDWVPVRMEYESPDGLGNDTLERVAMRLRGTRSRGKNPLAGFKLDFTKSLPDGANRRFAGLNRLNALSNEGDDSNMLQCMGYKLMRDFGIEAPACNHLRVSVNGEPYGLMENVERAKDARFLKHHFGTSDGPLYAASASCGFADSLADLEYKGDVFDEQYTKIYEVLRGSAADAEANLIPMLKCGDLTATPDDAEFAQCIEEWLDLDQWLKEIAAESLIPSLEDFIGVRRNFFLYFQPAADAPHGGKMKVWGWDYDTVLQRATCYPGTCDPFTAVANWYGPLGKRQKLVTRLTSVFKERYCGFLNSFLSEVYSPEKVDEMAKVIESAMSEDPIVTPDAWQAEVTRMRNYIVDHKVTMQASVDKACSN